MKARHLVRQSGLVVVRVLAFVAAVWMSLYLLHRATSRRDLPSPRPLEILKALPGLTQIRYSERPQITAMVALKNTVLRVARTTVVALAVGILVGLALAYQKGLWVMMQPALDFYRSIPVTFFLPGATLLFGSTYSEAPWILAAVPCSFIMILHVRTGAASLAEARVFSFEVLAGSRNPIRTFFRLRVPMMMPEIVTGLRVTVSYAIVIVSVLEYMNVGSDTIGFGLILSNVDAAKPNDPAAYAAVISFGVLGVVLNYFLEAAERAVAHWRDVR